MKSFYIQIQTVTNIGKTGIRKPAVI